MHLGLRAVVPTVHFAEGKQVRFLHLFEEKLRLYPLFSIHELKRLSSLSTRTTLLRRRTLNPLA
jgi:hypothetical protein